VSDCDYVMVLQRDEFELVGEVGEVRGLKLVSETSVGLSSRLPHEDRTTTSRATDLRPTNRANRAGVNNEQDLIIFKLTRGFFLIKNFFFFN
jgi:hypothetical protein